MLLLNWWVVVILICLLLDGSPQLEFFSSIWRHLQSSGAINRFLAHLIFVGLPASGKSTLIANLLKLGGGERLRNGDSTGIVDGIVTVNLSEDEASVHAASIGENCEWHQVEFGLSCLRQMGINFFVSKQKECIDQFMLKDYSPTSHEVVPSPLSEATMISSPEHPTRTTPVEAFPQAPFNQGPDIAKYSPTSMAHIQVLLQKEGFSAVRPYLDKKSTLYLSDTGN